MKIVLVFLVCVMCSNQVYSDNSRLRKEILECADKVTAWQIEYDIVSPNMKRGEKVIHRNVALRFPDSLFHWAGNSSWGFRRSWKEDVLQQRTIVSGQQYYWDFPMRRASRTRDCNSRFLFPGSLNRELLWDVVIWWPFTTDSNHQLSSESSTVEDVLRDDNYEFLDSLEEVDDHLCYVLRCEGKCALWFDRHNPCMMRKREWYKLAGIPVWRAELLDYREIEDGIYCPSKITWTALRINSIDGSEVRFNEFTALIVSAKFNESVPTDLFRFPEPLPGHVETTADGYQQIRPGANEYADSILQWVSNLPTKPVEIKGISRGELAFHVGLYCFAALTFFRSAWRGRIKKLRHVVNESIA